MLLTGFAVIAVATAAPAVLDYGWLTGCWRGGEGGRVIEEYWTTPAGGILLGAGRTVRDGQLRSYEFMRIQVIEGKLTFTAVPAGQSETAFTATSATPDKVVFENPVNDFPKRVVYERVDDNRFKAFIDGPMDGKTVVINYDYVRCGATPAK